MAPVDPISLTEVKSYPLGDRESKVHIADFGRPCGPGTSLGEWVSSLPRILAGSDLREVIERMAVAVRNHRLVLLGMGAHGIKVGLNPIILDLLRRGVLGGIAMNGAGIIHDTEVAMVGGTSEDVDAGIGQGAFGMAEETGRLLNNAIREGARREWGLGRAVGAMLSREGFPFNHMSILACAFEHDIPVTVHVAMGTDIIHFHPSVDGEAIGKTSHLDFRIFSRLVSRLEKGVFLNLGSAVILPEVFLKALTLVRNIGHVVLDVTTVNMDFNRHYRPLTNVVHRPTLEGGKGFNLVGHHEIMFPLLAAALVEELGHEGVEGR
jgi:hypothetical protein